MDEQNVKRCGLMQKKDITQLVSLSFCCKLELWFDVEERYNTTLAKQGGHSRRLWFDVEERYNTTVFDLSGKKTGCGLMQKKDITQQ